jgi:hypothetical protein
MVKKQLLTLVISLTICLASCTKKIEYTGKKCLAELGSETGIFKIKMADIYECSNTLYHVDGSIVYKFLIKKDSFYMNQIKAKYPISLHGTSGGRFKGKPFSGSYVTPKEEIKIKPYKNSKEQESKNDKLLITHTYFGH